MSVQNNELRMQIERLDYENKEAGITVDILREQNQDLSNELEEHKKTVQELRSSQRDPALEDKEKKKAEKMAMMMAQFDTVCPMIPQLSLITTCPAPLGCVLGERGCAPRDAKQA